MAMLAEKKSKQKWSHDPRNKAWSTNTDRFGYQMLTKMGWSDGKGLGASESGSTSHVKVSLKNNNLGVGAKISHDDNWLAHQDDFNDLLAQLNNVNNDGTSSKDEDLNSKNNDMETIARNSKKRVFYQRFIKSKNTSSYSAKDMACIMGQRSKSAPDSPADLSENEMDSDDSCASCPAPSTKNVLGMTTIKSEQSVQEYFAMKMAELKEKRRQENGVREDTRETSSSDKDEKEDSEKDRETHRKSIKKKKVSKKRKISETESSYDFRNTENKKKRKNEGMGNADFKEDLQESREKPKKKRKEKKRKLDEDECSSSSNETKYSKIKNKETFNSVIVDNEFEEGDANKKEKRKDKSKKAKEKVVSEPKMNEKNLKKKKKKKKCKMTKKE